MGIPGAPWTYVAGTAVIVALVAVAAAFRAKRVDRALLLWGLRNCLVASAVAWVLLSVVSCAAASGPGSLFANLAVLFGAVIGTVVAVAFLALGSGFLAVGLLLGGGKGWAGSAWLVGPIVGLLSGLLLVPVVDTLWRSFGPYAPIVSSGSVDYDISHGQTRIEGEGMVPCQHYRTTSYQFVDLELGRSGAIRGFTLNFQADDLTSLDLDLGPANSLTLYVDEAGQLTVAPGSTFVSGSLEFAIEKATETLAGTISWECPQQ